MSFLRSKQFKLEAFRFDIVLHFSERDSISKRLEKNIFKSFLTLKAGTDSPSLCCEAIYSCYKSEKFWDNQQTLYGSRWYVQISFLGPIFLFEGYILYVLCI